MRPAPPSAARQPPPATVSAVAVVAAAGAGRRLTELAPGGHKLALPYAGGTVLGHTLAALREGGVGRVVTVVADAGGPVAEVARRSGADVVVNPDPSRGMLSSLLAGVAALGPIAATGGPDVLMLLPGDLPRLRAATVGALLACFATHRPALLAPRLDAPAATEHGRRGHPLLLRADQLHRLAELDVPARPRAGEPDAAAARAAGLRYLFELLAGQLLEVPVTDPGIRRDVDTPADYAALTSDGAP